MRRGAIAIALGVLVAGCQPASEPGPATTTTDSSAAGQPSAVATSSDAGSSTAPGPTSTPSTSAAASTAQGSDGPPRWVEVAAGFDAPVATIVDPRTGDLLVVELPGRIKRLDGSTVLDLTDRVISGGERGLLDATTTPEGDRLLVHYSGVDGATTLASFPLQPSGADVLADRDEEAVLMTLDQPAANHNGGSIVFGPDGHLYMALGDGGGANDQFGNGNDLDTPLGAILRLDVTSDPGAARPAADNPWVDGGGDARVWASGVRNPWRITHDGSRWFVADVGQDAVEEVTLVPVDTGPHDLGWPSWEGDVCRLEPCDDTALAPVHTLRHSDGVCSILGGAVATTPPVDTGTYYFTDLCDPRVWRLDPDTGEVEADTALPSPALALDVDVDGSVVALTQSGQVLVRTRG